MTDTSAKPGLEDLFLETPSESQTLEQDLLEDSERILHKEMTKIQVIMYKQRIHQVKALEAWAQEQYHTRPDAVAWIRQQARDALKVFDKNQDWERKQQKRRLQAEQGERDRLISLFSKDYGRTR